MNQHANRLKHEQLVLSFLQSHPMATVSTVNNKTLQPESALVAYAETRGLSIIFETFYETRKYQNMSQNPKVSFVIGWDTQQYITLQYEGIAQQIPEAEVSEYREIFLCKDTPCTEQFLLDPRVRLFIVKPTWIRYSNYTQTVPDIIELNF